jgi:hypothetical protein
MWVAWSEDWALYDKVSFDGVNKIVYVHPEVTTFDIRADLYTSWIDWIVLQDNLKYDPMMRTTGLDPIGPGVFTGDVYFLINNWKLSINLQKVKVTGVLYSDDYDTAYYTEDLSPQYPATVSALVNTVTSAGGGSGPTAAQIRQEIDNNSTKLIQIKAILDSIDIPTPTENAAAVWNSTVSGHTITGTFGHFMQKKLITVAKFLGLK